MKIETGRDIAAERTRLGVAQTRLARLLGMPPYKLSKIEQGKLPLDDEAAEAVKRILATIKAMQEGK
jgi:transcriptional regulator with XRE-family HTH domain